MLGESFAISLDYLDHYVSLSNPGYAVLVTGAWGVGKTFQVERKLQSENPIYVSLYGEPTVDAIQEALLVASAPLTSKGRYIVELWKSANGKFGGLSGAASQVEASLVMRQMRRNIDKSRLIIFDDLERSLVAPGDVLGMINHYVEHHGCRVVVIAHEGMLDPKTASAREKIFGLSLVVKPEIEQCFDAILEDLQSEYLPNLLSRLIDVFRLSGVDSLRVARQMTHDVHRLLAQLTPEHLNNNEALLDVVTHFAIWAVEVHSGRFDRRLLKLYDDPVTMWRMRERKSRRGDETTPEEAADLDLIEKVSSRYWQLVSNLTLGALGKNTLVEMLFDGDFNIEAIHRELDMSPLYVTAADLPSWQVLFYWRQYSNDEVNNAAECLSELFLSRTETDPGVLCHMFSSKLWLAHGGLSGISLNDAKDQCISYIDYVEA